MHESTIPVLSATPRITRTLLEWATDQLHERGFDEARLHAELLLSHALHTPRLALSLEADRQLSEETIRHFDTLFRRRLHHEPLQYILGTVEFYGVELRVDRSVLIPRPETELLVEHTLETIRGFGRRRTEILDIGTGSGNIAIAVGKHSPDVEITAIDVSAEALAVAAENIRHSAVSNVTLVEVDVFDDIFPGRFFDVIVSNPPYVPASEFPDLAAEIRNYEPRIATTDEGDGLRVIRRISALAREKLRGDGVVLMEIGFDKKGSVQKVLNREGFKDIQFHDDYAGIPRVVKARRP